MPPEAVPSMTFRLAKSPFCSAAQLDRPRAGQREVGQGANSGSQIATGIWAQALRDAQELVVGRVNGPIHIAVDTGIGREPEPDRGAAQRRGAAIPTETKIAVEIGRDRSCWSRRTATPE